MTQHDDRTPQRSRRHYAWVIFAVTFITLLAAAGFRSAPGVLLDPLHDSFGWSRATIGAAGSVNLLLYGLVGPFAAALMMRYGLRRVIIGALLLISTGALATTQMTQPWHLVATWGVMVGIGSGCMATVLAANVATRWFVKGRGTVVGALTAASATGQLIFLPVLTHLAESSGWRSVSITIALSALCVVPLVAVFLRDQPSDLGLLPYGAPEEYVPPTPTSNPIRAAFAGLRFAARDRRFWLLFSAFFVCGLSTNGLIGQHFISAAHDHGITPTTAGSLLAIVGVFDVVGTIGSGWLTDRMDSRILLLVYYGLRGVSLLFLDHALDIQHAGLVTFMIFYGLDWVATVPPTVALCNQSFGSNRGPLIYGWVFAGHQLGAAVAASGAGWIRDTTGSYRSAFLIAGTLCVLVAVSTMLVRPPDRESKVAAAVPRVPA